MGIAVASEATSSSTAPASCAPAAPASKEEADHNNTAWAAGNASCHATGHAGGGSGTTDDKYTTTADIRVSANRCIGATSGPGGANPAAAGANSAAAEACVTASGCSTAAGGCGPTAYTSCCCPTRG